MKGRAFHIYPGYVVSNDSDLELEVREEGGERWLGKLPAGGRLVVAGHKATPLRVQVGVAGSGSWSGPIPLTDGAAGARDLVIPAATGAAATMEQWKRLNSSGVVAARRRHHGAQTPTAPSEPQPCVVSAEVSPARGVVSLAIRREARLNCVNETDQPVTVRTRESPPAKFTVQPGECIQLGFLNPFVEPPKQVEVSVDGKPCVAELHAHGHSA